jgi:hypothetical protein
MATVRKAAPKADYTQQADTQHVITIAGATDLLAIVGKPNFAPQRMVFLLSAGGSVTLTPEKGVDFTLTVLPNFPTVHDAAVKAIVSATASMVAHIYWWDPHGSLNWNAE